MVRVVLQFRECCCHFFFELQSIVAPSLQELLTLPNGKESFGGFLAKEFSEENLMFFLQVESFKRMEFSSRIAFPFLEHFPHSSLLSGMGTSVESRVQIFEKIKA